MIMAHVFKKAYKDFCDAWHIKLTTYSPRYAFPVALLRDRSDGLNLSLLERCIQNKENINLDLLDICATPLDGNI